ncbi:MAG TPA: F0F1 ATP synthase subunit A [Pseudonocardiaceae bacterium]
MSDVTMAAGGGISVGQHLQASVFGFTINVDTVISTVLAAGIVLGFGLYLRARYHSGAKVPTGGQLAFEAVTVQIEKQVEQNLGLRTAPFVVPLAISLFFFILISNWLSLLPHAFEEYARPPSADINFTLPLAFMVIVLVHITGVRKKGTGHYFAHFAKPFPALLPIEIIQEIVKPFSLALRLFGNILAGTVMVAVLALLPGYISWAPTAAWKLFDLFIGLLQAVIFVILTIIYFGMAAGPDQEEAH